MQTQQDQTNSKFHQILALVPPTPVHPQPGIFETTVVKVRDTHGKLRPVNHRAIERLLATPYGMDRVHANLKKQGW